MANLVDQAQATVDEVRRIVHGLALWPSWMHGTQSACRVSLTKWAFVMLGLHVAPPFPRAACPLAAATEAAVNPIAQEKC